MSACVEFLVSNGHTKRPQRTRFVGKAVREFVFEIVSIVFGHITVHTLELELARFTVEHHRVKQFNLALIDVRNDFIVRQPTADITLRAELNDELPAVDVGDNALHYARRSEVTDTLTYPQFVRIA